MITKAEFAKLMGMEEGLMCKQVDGLSHADSLLQPQPGGNCLNWVMGHLAGNLADMLTTLGGELPADLPDLARYGFDSDPICGEEAQLVDLQVLVSTASRLSALVINRLEQMTEADFDDEIEFWQGKSRRGYVAFFYFFHHTYHLGQLEYLRNLAGKTEKLI
jgi:hypothetical protein